jgi:hypothetical protein
MAQRQSYIISVRPKRSFCLALRFNPPKKPAFTRKSSTGWNSTIEQHMPEGCKMGKKEIL